MKYRYCATQALVNLWSARLRSFLALLGVLIGTAAVVALLSCGQLATEKALAQFTALGTDLLSVSLYPSKAQKEAATRFFTLSFWRSLPLTIPALKKVAPYAIMYPESFFMGQKWQYPIIGADEMLARVLHLSLQQGRFVSSLESFEHYCVIGKEIASLWQAHFLSSPVGKQIRIDQTLYTIVGVLAPWPSSMFFPEDINRSIVVPIAGISLLQKDVTISHAVFSVEKNTEVIRALLEKKVTQQVPGVRFFSRSPKQIIASMQKQKHTLLRLLLAIGGISLLVGGIGIMNIMLVSVSERKREIGLRKAVGATEKDIARLFLIEALALSFVGGGIGIGVGCCISYGIAVINQWSWHFYGFSCALSFAISLFVGVFFGFYPAKRAAMMEPIDCLK